MHGTAAITGYQGVKGEEKNSDKIIADRQREIEKWNERLSRILAGVSDCPGRGFGSNPSDESSLPGTKRCSEQSVAPQSFGSSPQQSTLESGVLGSYEGGGSHAEPVYNGLINRQQASQAATASRGIRRRLLGAMRRA